MKQNLDKILQNSQKELEIYVELLKKWQKAVNLISTSTIDDVWNRHIVDSAQLYLYIPELSKSLIDMGSGAGFPGIVLAILNKINNGPLQKITLIESDTKKCLFLREVVRILSLPVQILNQRIETVKDLSCDILTARALGSLNQLIKLGQNFIHKNTICLFLKGKNVDQEVNDLSYSCKIDKIKSLTNSKSYVLKIMEASND